ncbi:ABC transporter ATP-binding protein [Akkermansiaceae bacterium]|nr:ABC transporter ATP-binding protein [Akkermansiaceae bacterium]MDA7519683.1 ABC transporter ATP-binding protein [bacterium]MDA7517340.1 ABC transporter ATP-binding protein [Akkermansiaceae bacterium]MDA7610651.1 ABC transporter ATP-binding protein [bacterium]MDA7618904.1 ABC transporter ATP-binding protein [bacterium]
MTNPILRVKDLKKRFAGKDALKGVSFEVQKGEIYGLLGHNGAGKSTTVGIILGMVSADGGEVEVGGVSVLDDHTSALKKVGAIFEAPAFYDYMSGWQNLKVLVGLSGKFDPKAAREVVESVGLTDRIDSKVGSYSHGMRQRLALAQALLPEPEILLLDEPTDGLDPEGIKWFRDFILSLREERGITVLFNSHLLSEVEQMCDRVSIIRGGEHVFQGKVNDLRDDRLGLKISAEPGEARQEIITRFRGEEMPGGRIVFPEETAVPEIVSALVQAGAKVSEITPVRRSLEDVYLEYSNAK